MVNRKVVWVVVGLIVIVGAFVGLTIISNVTGNTITGAVIKSPTMEQESFKINDDVNEGEVNNGSQNSG